MNCLLWLRQIVIQNYTHQTIVSNRQLMIHTTVSWMLGFLGCGRNLLRQWVYVCCELFSTTIHQFLLPLLLMRRSDSIENFPEIYNSERREQTSKLIHYTTSPNISIMGKNFYYKPCRECENVSRLRPRKGSLEGQRHPYPPLWQVTLDLAHDWNAPEYFCFRRFPSTTMVNCHGRGRCREWYYMRFRGFHRRWRSDFSCLPYKITAASFRRHRFLPNRSGIVSGHYLPPNETEQLREIHTNAVLLRMMVDWIKLAAVTIETIEKHLGLAFLLLGCKVILLSSILFSNNMMVNPEMVLSLEDKNALMEQVVADYVSPSLKHHSYSKESFESYGTTLLAKSEGRQHAMLPPVDHLTDALIHVKGQHLSIPENETMTWPATGYCLR